MSITTSITVFFKQGMLAGTYNCSTDTFKMALYNSSATLSSATTVYSATNEISGSGYVAGGVTLSGNTIFTDTTTVGVSFSNAVFPAAGIMTVSDIRGCTIYDTSHSNAVVAVFDFGGASTINAGTFTINMPAQTTADGLVRFL